MNPRNHVRLTAWLGMIAMWLIMLAPVVSQSLAASRSADSVVAMSLCTTADTSVVMHVTWSTHKQTQDKGMNACGYCDLLATHSALPAVAPVLPVVVMVPALAAPVIPADRFTPLGAFPSGRPRAPPAFSRT